MHYAAAAILPINHPNLSADLYTSLITLIPMMASFMSYFGGSRKDPKSAARDAIVGLRQQLQMIEKKQEYLEKKIEEEQKKARANAVSNKAGT